MSSLITSLKSEITRVARKELKGELQALRKTTTTHRSEIAALKRLIKTLATELKAIKRTDKTLNKTASSDQDSAKPTRIRFTAQRLFTQRTKLGLSKVEMAKLIGASSLSVHKWEAGTTQPRVAQMEKIASVMKMGKKEAQAALQS